MVKDFKNEDGGEYYQIDIGDNAAYCQRKRESSPSDDPLIDSEIAIIKLCEEVKRLQEYEWMYQDLG